MNILMNCMLAIYVLVALLMLLVILMQRPKSEGLGAAFGGGVTENIFGAQTTNVLTKATAWLAGAFFLLTFVLSILYAHRSMTSSSLRRELLKTEAAASAGKSKNAAQVPAAATPGPVSPAPADAAVGVVPPASVPVAPPSATSSPAPPNR
jgi:preprotein translocase subunit SecG